jgi:Holliday junction DNA helicase RuvA
MFNSISGTITAKMPLSLFVETSGIEWDIMVPTLSLDTFGPVGAITRVYTWMYHREDQMRLFGFPTVAERDIFIDLMKVEGIGPKQAIKILSSITAGELEKALDGEDLARLEAAPGIGKKTAQKMILALKGKLTHENDSPKRRGTGGKTPHEDIVNALTGMGFDRQASADAVENAAHELANGSNETVIHMKWNRNYSAAPSSR